MKPLLKVICFSLLLSILILGCDNEIIEPGNSSLPDSILLVETKDYIYIKYLDSLVIYPHDTTDIDINYDGIFDLQFLVKEYRNGELVTRRHELMSLTDSCLISEGDTYYWADLRYVEEGEILNEEWVIWRISLLIYSYEVDSGGIIATRGCWGRSDKTSGYIVLKRPIIEGVQSYGWLKMAVNDSSFILYESLMYKKDTPFIYVGDTTKWIP